MKKVDVLFLYETKVRELESVCLIKSELEKRGFSVAVMNTWSNLGIRKPLYKAKVVVTHGMYHDGIYLFVKDFCGDVPKVVNMQWEQIGQIGDEDSLESRYVLKGIAKQCLHICWGNRTYRRLHDIAGIDDKHLALTGSVALDFCKKGFEGFFRSREELLDAYKVDSTKHINLFISSFSYVNLPERFIEGKDDKNKKFIDFSIRSFNEILTWFDQFLSNNDDQIIIYRPHPAEAGNENLIKLEEKHPGQFRVISELSVKQWISIADRVYSWYSTSVAEAYMFGIPVSILRPVDIPDGIEVSLYENARFIRSYSEFLDTQRTESISSIDSEIFHDIYFIDDGCAFKRVADAIEKVLGDNSYLIKDPPTLPKQGLKQKSKQFVFDLISTTVQYLPDSITVLNRFKKKEERDLYTIERQKNNYASDSEINSIQKHIEEVLSKNV